MLPLVLTAAIVVEDQTFLRVAPEEKAPHPVLLSKGDWVEVRGEAHGYLQVYDYRHERPGYVVPERVRRYPLEPASAPRLLAVLEFLRDREGDEALGIAYAALYLRAASADGVTADVFDALGVMAERLADRVSARTRSGTALDQTLPGQLELAEAYGVHFLTYEREGRLTTLYDGEAFRRVLDLTSGAGDGGRAAARGRAVLALTRASRLEPARGELDRQALVEWQAALLARVDPSDLAPLDANRLRVRRAEVLARLAFQRAKKGDAEGARAAAEGAIDALARVDKAELRAVDKKAWDEAAVLVSAERWAKEPPALPAQSDVAVKLRAGETGETCLEVSFGGGKPAVRCTHGVVWPGSLSLAPGRDRLVIVAEPVLGWTELWVFSRRPAPNGADTLVPAIADPELGYVEPAGWTPAGKLLAVREARVDGALTRSFELVDPDVLVAEKKVAALDRFATFKRHASAAWRGSTLALR